MKDKQEELEEDKSDEIQDEQCEIEESVSNDDSVEKSDEELYKDKYIRLQADFQNYRRRVEEERNSLINLGIRKLAEDLLPALDNLERAIKSMEDRDIDEETIKGMLLIKGELLEIFNKNGITEIADLNEKFDPNFHYAIAMVSDTDKEPGIVIDVLQKGYKIDDIVIRPTMVRVSE